ncbi:MAG: hypothetical protein WAQ07_01830 [Candidatus Omnitrophota bacterium]
MVYLYRGGCLLPFLIFFNLFFGRIFFSLKLWLIIEGVLILIFFLYSYILSKKLLSGVNNLQKRSGVIDVEAEVVDKNKDKSIE